MASRNRGKPKKGLRHLSSEPASTEESNAVAAHFTEAQSPIVAAILGQSLIENELDAMLRDRLAVNDDTHWAELNSDNGPLFSFNSKIMLGRVLKLYTAELEHNLHIVRKIRNAFAHSKKLITFDNQLIVADCAR